MQVAITGMHRSGTSMVAHLLRECGVYLGPEEKIKNAAFDNPDGFWEHPEFVNINNQLLELFGGGWDLLPNFPTGWEKSHQVHTQRIQAEKLIAEFNTYPVWGWKDPRTSLTIPFWKTSIPKLKFIVLVRNPISVSKSLEHRGFSSYQFSTQLWMGYYRQILEHIESQSHIITHYDSFFYNSYAELRRIVDFLGLQVSDESIAQANAIVKTALRNNPTKIEDLIKANIPQEVIETYVELCSKSGPIYRDVAEQEWQEIQSETPSYPSQFKPWNIQPVRIHYLQKAYIEISQQLSLAEQHVKDLSKQVEDLGNVTQILSKQNEEKDLSLVSLQAKVEVFNLQITDFKKYINQIEQEGELLKSDLFEKETALKKFLTKIEQLNKSNIFLKEQLEENRNVIEAQQSQLGHNEKMIAVRDEGIAWLRNEIKLMEASRFWKLRAVYWTLRNYLTRLTYAVRHLITWFSKSRTRKWLARITPYPVKQFLRKIIGKTRSHESTQGLVSLTENFEISEEPIKKDFYSSITILPTLTDHDQSAVIAQALSTISAHPVDIICFSIIDWDFRYQRPQQIMSLFASKGHRVFYISTSEFQTDPSGPKILIRNIKQNIFEISLMVNRPPDIYGEVIEDQNSELMHAALEELRKVYQIEDAISYVMISSWSNVALKTRKAWGWRVVYDCMDEWNNFPLIQRAIIDAEIRLVQECDLLIVTSQQLYETWEKYNRPTILVRNAADYEFYEKHYHANDLLKETASPIIGYYGAIADWFDLDLMAYIAEQRPNYTFVLLGGVFDVDVSHLRSLKNVKLLGQQPYETMPQYLYHFNVCIIPFKINSITEATDPVKVYEYLCSGKPVVSVALSELKPYSEIVYLANSKEDFLTKLDEAITEENKDLVIRRKEFASKNTWNQRYEKITIGLSDITPRASIIIITHNNLALTKLCLESIIRNTDYLNYEIIIIDNKSTDGTPSFLQDFTGRNNNIKIVLNQNNESFSSANNQGLALAEGEYLILLNNDTIVPPGWLSRLTRYLKDPKVGLVGPMTNFVGNEAKLDVNYTTWEQMETFAKRYTWDKEGLAAEIHMLAMYCVAFRRDVFKVVGSLDEQFKIGMFEDDDYSQRIKEKGYKVICAQDVFVHHFGQSAFKKLIENNSYNSIFEENRRRYEEKWNTKWIPHKHASLISDYYPIRPNLQKQIDPNTGVSPNKQDEYAQNILRENLKWGEHLKIEASGEWYAWLDHPMVTAHYQERSLIDGLQWKEWVKKKLGTPASKSLDLGCGAGERSLDLWRTGSSKFIEGVDVSEDRIIEGEKRRLSIGASGRFWISDANTIDLPQNTYDIIFSAHSFHHFLNLEHIMEQVEKALTANGLFILEEFVGPTQFQWTDIQLNHTKNLLKAIPDQLRTFRDGRIKTEEGRPTPEEVMAVSPFESIRSAEILSLFKEHFDIVAIRNLGGTIQHLLYNGIIQNFQPEDANATKYIKMIIEAEDELIDSGQLTSDFMLLIGQKRR